MMPRLLRAALAAIAALMALTLAPAKDAPRSVCHDNDCFPVVDDSIDPPVHVQGVGLLRYWGFRVYTAALYVPEDWKDGDAAPVDEKPLKLELRYHRSISRDDIVRASEKAIASNPSTDVAALRERLDRINAWYVDVRQGDKYELVYRPDRGTSLYFNDEYIGTVEGEDFALAKFGIWLDPDHCLSKELRGKLVTPYEGD